MYFAFRNLILDRFANSEGVDWVFAVGEVEMRDESGPTYFQVKDTEAKANDLLQQTNKNIIAC